MQDTIRKATQKQYGVLPKTIKQLGGGFYGRAFAVSLDCEPYLTVLKVYLFPHLAVKEAGQIETLSKYALLKMPRIYQVYEKDETGFAYDIVFMEYLRGINAGDLDISRLPEGSRSVICEEIVDNLIAYHREINTQGFGALSSENYASSWQEYYYPVARDIVGKMRLLADKGQISGRVLSVAERALKQFDDLFYLPVTEARLIHGDYNTWNIMLNEEKTHAVSVIDPFNCCWADSEFDLYQLDNANGKGYGLLERYAAKMPLSKNFEAKRRFYELYTELNHYYDSGVEVNQEAVEKLAGRMDEMLRE